jgi:hypothetical protein
MWVYMGLGRLRVRHVIASVLDAGRSCQSFAGRDNRGWRYMIGCYPSRLEDQICHSRTARTPDHLGQIGVNMSGPALYTDERQLSE